MNISTLIEQLNQGEGDFNTVIATIDAAYDFTPTQFTNGSQTNLLNSNNGSCKIFAFAQIHNLNQQVTLNAFGKFYNEDILQHPNGTDHANIRNFIKTGWDGIEFSKMPLSKK